APNLARFAKGSDRLAVAAVISGPLSQHHAADRFSAMAAAQRLAAIHEILLLKVTGAAIRMDEIAQAAAACSQGIAERVLHCHHQSPRRLAAEPAGRARRPDTGAEQAF